MFKSDKIKNLPNQKVEIIGFAFPYGAVFINYKPKEDMTNLELAYLIPLFAIGSAKVANKWVCPQIDFMAYIEEKGLTRHFEVTPSLE